MIRMVYDRDGFPISDWELEEECEFIVRSANSVLSTEGLYSTENIFWAAYIEVLRGKIPPTRLTFVANDKLYHINPTTKFIETKDETGNMVSDANFLPVNSNQKREMYQLLFEEIKQ